MVGQASRYLELEQFTTTKICMAISPTLTEAASVEVDLQFQVQDTRVLVPPGTFYVQVIIRLITTCESTGLK